MKTVSYSMAGIRDYAAEVVPRPYASEEISETDSCFYQLNLNDSILVDESGLFENDWFAVRAFGRE
ncbi:MAG: hypothetical protein LUC90_09250 [Lachnospiraceae bacterium]|nr:hypothetical protein [Lachnospiraceae bacterium]